MGQPVRRAGPGFPTSTRAPGLSADTRHTAVAPRTAPGTPGSGTATAIADGQGSHRMTTANQNQALNLAAANQAAKQNFPTEDLGSSVSACPARQAEVF